MILHLKSYFLSVFALAFAVIIAVTPVSVSAHGEAGLTLSATSTTKDKPPYIVDVDYSDAVIEAQRMGRLDFNLFADAERTKPVEFTDMWVRIVKEDGARGQTLYAGSVAKQTFGGNGFGFVFPEGGTYSLSVRYNDANKDTFGETVAEANFTLDVLRSEEENAFNFASAEFFVGIVSGLSASLLGLLPLLMRKKTA